MDDHNSLSEFYLGLYLTLHTDVVGDHASVRKIDYVRDQEEIRNRVRSEGLGFLTKTLPRLGKAIDKALSKGVMLQFTSFKRRKGTELPAFCWELFNKIFDSAGRERSDACPMALKQLRQLCFVLYKLKLPYDLATADEAIKSFVQTDQDLEFNLQDLNPVEMAIAEHARRIVRRVLSGICPLDITPRHGPGAVATGETSDRKRYFSRFYPSLDRKYPYTEYFYANLQHVADRLDHLQTLESLEHGTAKVVLVPKDSRGPRIIS